MVSLTDGSQLVTDTETNLFDLDTSVLYYAVWIDLTPILAADTFRIKVYVDEANAGTERTYLDESMVGVQAPSMIFIPPIPADHLRVTMQRTAGTNRTFAWRRADT